MKLTTRYLWLHSQMICERVSSYFLCIRTTKNYVRCALKGDQVHKRGRRTTGPRREAKEKGKTGRCTAG